MKQHRHVTVQGFAQCLTAQLVMPTVTTISKLPNHIVDFIFLLSNNFEISVVS